jgi:hypothetical protein
VLAVEPALRADRLGGLLAAVGGVGFLCFAYGLARSRSWAVPWAVLVFGAAYAGSLFLPEEGVDRHVPLFAVGFVLLAEFGYWTLELRAPISPEPGMLEQRAALVVAIGLGALVIATIAVIATLVPLGGGVLADLLGVAAAIGAVGVVAWLAERGRPQSST